MPTLSQRLLSYKFLIEVAAVGDTAISSSAMYRSTRLTPFQWAQVAFSSNWANHSTAKDMFDRVLAIRKLSEPVA